MQPCQDPSFPQTTNEKTDQNANDHETYPDRKNYNPNGWGVGVGYFDTVRRQDGGCWIVVGRFEIGEHAYSVGECLDVSSTSDMSAAAGSSGVGRVDDGIKCVFGRDGILGGGRPRDGRIGSHLFFFLGLSPWPFSFLFFSFFAFEKICEDKNSSF